MTTITTPPTTEEIETMLNDLAKARKMLEDLEKEIDKQVLDLIPAPVASAIAELRDEMKPQTDAMKAKMKDLETEIRAKALALGQTVIGDELEVLVGTRTSWDTDKLDEGAKWVPAIAECRKESDPFTTLRKVKK